MTIMTIMRIKRKRVPLLHPTTISQTLKAARKGHIALQEASRLEVLRHRRGACVARDDEHPGHRRGARQPIGEGVLATAAADDQDSKLLGTS